VVRTVENSQSLAASTRSGALLPFLGPCVGGHRVARPIAR